MIGLRGTSAQKMDGSQDKRCRRWNRSRRWAPPRGARSSPSSPSRDQLYKIGLPGKSIIRDYFRENRTSRRPFLLLRISCPGRPILYNCLQRNTCGPDDVTIDIKYCGICHTDVHFARDPLPMPVPFPLVPGHEVAGVVSKVGKNVKDVKVGDYAGVGCFVDSCFECRYFILCIYSARAQDGLQDMERN